MSIFNELILPKITEIPKAYVKSFNDDLKAAFASFQKFEEEFQNGKAKAREKSVKDKTLLTTLQSIDEDEDEPKTNKANSKSSSDRSSTESASSKRGSKKRSKHEVDGMSSPEQEKRHKRNASVKAQSIISKQKTLNDSVEIVSDEVNVNLTQKLRRENSLEKTKGRRRKDDDKENAEPIIPAVQVKEEKISIAPEPMDMESLPLDVEVKQELDKDDIAMPPPSMPVPKQRKAAQKDKVDDTSDEEPTRRRTTRTKKQTDTQPAPVASTRSTRASNRATKQTESEDSVAVAEARPKRTRGKKAAPETSTDTDKDSRSTQDSGIASPAEKPRPKRTRKLQKNKKDEEPPQEVETPPTEVEIQQPVIVKEERISQPEYSSPLLQKIVHKTNKVNDKTVLIESRNITVNGIQNGVENGIENGVESAKDLEETRVISKAMDTTVVLPNGVYNHASISPKNNRNMNVTVVLETCNQTVVLDKPKVMDSTVVIDKGSKTNLTDDNSLLTDDESVEMKTPPKQTPKVQQPTSAVKEKVQQFEEMASRVTRTKTRAMKKQEVQQEADTQTPPDKVSKVILSADNLNKMNNMIFNGKSTIPVSNSASKPRVNTASSNKAYSSTSKLSGINKAREAAEEYKMEDARRKKEAMLEAKREMQKKKREEKMAAAAAAREAAERERRLALAAAAKEKQEKQLHVDMGKLEKLKEVEKKKQELARKVQETEERRKAEELARQKRLEEEQRKAREMRKRQLEEADKMKKEAALMEREIERKQREFIEKQKLKQRMEEVSAMKTPRKYPPIDPVYMQDGFQYLNSDEEADPIERPMPTWSSSKARYRHLSYQNCIPVCHIDKLFSVREHTPDLREIFPNIDRSRLKRTSSAVWRSPARLAALHE